MKANTRGHVIAGIALGLAITVGAGAWRWADHLYLAGDRRMSFWIGILGTALPALALAACGISLRWRGAPAEAAASFIWMVPVFALTCLFLAFIVAVSIV